MIRSTAQRTILSNARLVTPTGVLKGQDVLVSEGRIEAVVPTGSETEGELVNLLGRTLFPGFIDTQVNGGGGALFNSEPTLESIRTISRAHARFGTTGLLPTLISDELEVIEAGLTAVSKAIDHGEPGILGIHIEGPFINEARRGVHSAEKIRRLTMEMVEQLKPLAEGATLLTLAPEQVEPGMIAALVAKGFIVSAGHSAASYAEVRRALGEGLRGFTHLFNAMSPFTAREPGMVGAALDHDQAYCGLIADGVHVSDAALRLAFRAKGPGRLMLVTDAMPPLGTDLDHFDLLGETVSVNHGVCRDGRGALAGSSLDMASALRHFLSVSGCGLAEVARMASTTPAQFLGLAGIRGAIAEGQAADFAILDEGLRPVATIIAGATVWPGRDA
ncbi:MAG: N-acetylglucosamine-6-phosphate deacetylase [Pseudomonadota bacterium]